MSNHTAEICIDIPDLEIGITASVSYSIWGSYRAATHEDPAEYPELDDINVNEWEVDDDYRKDTSVPVNKQAVEAAVSKFIDDGKLDDELWDIAGQDARDAQEAADEARYDAWEDAKYDDYDDDCRW